MMIQSVLVPGGQQAGVLNFVSYSANKQSGNYRSQCNRRLAQRREPMAYKQYETASQSTDTTASNHI